MGFFNKLLGRGQENGKQTERISITDYDPKAVYSPLNGTAVPLSKVSDPAFAQGFMGKGAAVLPSEGRLYAPASGTVAALFETCHAIGIMTEAGMEVLLHIGVDTVEMKGDGFKAHVKQGDQVSAGQMLISFDIGKIKGRGLDPVTMVLVSNYSQFGEQVLLAEGTVTAGQLLFHF